MVAHPDGEDARPARCRRAACRSTASSPAHHDRALAAVELDRRELLDAQGRRDQTDERLAGLQEAPWYRRNRRASRRHGGRCTVTMTWWRHPQCGWSAEGDGLVAAIGHRPRYYVEALRWDHVVKVGGTGAGTPDRATGNRPRVVVHI